MMLADERKQLTRVDVTVTGVESPLAGVLGGAIVGGLVDTKGDLRDLLAVVELDALGGNVSGDDTASSNLGHDEDSWLWWWCWRKERGKMWMMEGQEEDVSDVA